MTLNFTHPMQFFFHYSKAKGKTSLFINKRCYSVNRIVNYGPMDSKDIPLLNLILSMGFTKKIEIKNDTAMIY